MQSGQSDWHRSVSDLGSVEGIGQQGDWKEKLTGRKSRSDTGIFCIKMRSCREVPR